MLYNDIMKPEDKKKHTCPAVRAHLILLYYIRAAESRLKMKNLETLKTTLETVTNETLAAIIKNEDVATEDLTPTEKLSVLMYAELAKALKTKEHQLLLDCNYPDSKNVQNGVLLVDYYRLAAHGSMIQVYVKRNSFGICTSASKANREQFAALENDLGFITKYDKKTGRAKTTQRNGVTYEELVPVIKSVLAVLENTATAKKVEPTEE